MVAGYATLERLSFWIILSLIFTLSFIYPTVRALDEEIEKIAEEGGGHQDLPSVVEGQDLPSVVEERDLPPYVEEEALMPTADEAGLTLAISSAEDALTLAMSSPDDYRSKLNELKERNLPLEIFIAVKEVDHLDFKRAIREILNSFKAKGHYVKKREVFDGLNIFSFEVSSVEDGVQVICEALNLDLVSTIDVNRVYEPIDY